jgi:hypothetical protein
MNVKSDWIWTSSFGIAIKEHIEFQDKRILALEEANRTLDKLLNEKLMELINAVREVQSDTSESLAEMFTILVEKSDADAMDTVNRLPALALMGAPLMHTVKAIDARVPDTKSATAESESAPQTIKGSDCEHAPFEPEPTFMQNPPCPENYPRSVEALNGGEDALNSAPTIDAEFLRVTGELQARWEEGADAGMEGE